MMGLKYFSRLVLFSFSVVCAISFKVFSQFLRPASLRQGPQDGRDSGYQRDPTAATAAAQLRKNYEKKKGFRGNFRQTFLEPVPNLFHIGILPLGQNLRLPNNALGVVMGNSKNKFFGS